MTILGSLRVLGIYDGTKLNKGIDTSKKKTKEFTTGLTGLKTALGALGLALTADRLKQFATTQLDAIDQLSKQSRVLGISTQALGAYQHAAGLSGLTTEQLNTALQRMKDTIGAATLGEAGAARALTALGLDPHALSAATDPLEQIQQSIQAIGDSNTKLALVRDIFGRGGAQVLNLFETNLRGVRKEYEAMGLAISSDEGKRIEQLNDQMAVLSQRFTATGRRFLVDATPAVIQAVEGLTILMEQSGVIKKGQTAADRREVEKWAREGGALGNIFRPTLLPIPGIGRDREAIVRIFGEMAAPLFQTRQDRLNTIGSDATIRRRQMEALGNRPVVAQPSGLQ